MNPSLSQIYHNVFHRGTEAKSCLEQYRDIVEGMPGRMTKLQGRSVYTTVFVDEPHAAYQLTGAQIHDL